MLGLVLIIIVVLVILPSKNKGKYSHYKNPYYEENDFYDEPLDECDCELNFDNEDDKSFDDLTSFDDKYD